MRRLAFGLALVVLTGSTTASAVLQPGRSLANPSTIAALGLTDRSVVYAVREKGDRKQCAYVVLWDTVANRVWRLGAGTTLVCREGPSTGSGISQFSNSGIRSLLFSFDC
jgi:hypothetical protein